MTLAPADPRHGTYNGYTNGRCRCPDCKAANTDYRRQYDAKRPKRRPPRPWLLHCDTCRHTCELATDMHEHTLRAHGRRLTDGERTPRRDEG